MRGRVFVEESNKKPNSPSRLWYYSPRHAVPPSCAPLRDLAGSEFLYHPCPCCSCCSCYSCCSSYSSLQTLPESSQLGSLANLREVPCLAGIVLLAAGPFAP